MTGNRLLRAELAHPRRSRLGESPLWDTRSGTLIWVDIPSAEINTLRGSGHRVVALDTAVTAIEPRASGGWIAAITDGFATIDDDWAVTTVAPVEEITGPMRMNDGACDPDGRFWAGSMSSVFEEGLAQLYRLDAEHSVESKARAISVSNGLEWSPEGSAAYYADSPTRRVRRIPYGDGELQFPGDVLATIPQDLGYPDGLTVDADGGVWVAIWGGGQVRRYLPDGSHDVSVEVPTPMVTSCAFGGEGLDRLYITTAHVPTRGETIHDPAAGALFAVDPGVTGLEPRSFAG